jgi:transposase
LGVPGRPQGYIQADASNVFDRLFNGQAASAIELGCWSHGRRRLVALHDTDCRVAYPLKLIARLYRIEHLADARQLAPEARAELRQGRSQPVLEKLKRWFLAMIKSEPPSSDLAKAAGYALNHWEALTRFVKDGRVSPDNNLCYAARGISVRMPRARLCRVGDRTRPGCRDLDCAALVDAA